LRQDSAFAVCPVHQVPREVEKPADLVAQLSARLGQVLVAVVGLDSELECRV
jgi:hypothetical protein